MTVGQHEQAELVTRSTPRPPGRRPRLRGDGSRSALATAALLVALALAWELGSVAGLWSPDVLPAPSTVLGALHTLAGDPRFWADAARTGGEVLGSIVFGSVAGLLAGVGFWKAPLVGRIFEPYLVSFYAVPLVLFYPVMIVLVGLGTPSVVILASVMAAIPMALNTWVGLAGIPPVYLKLSRSIGCTRWQELVRVALPSAAPFVLAGLRLAVVYALIGCIAMEFTTAQAGLGYRIRYLYDAFETTPMYAYILVVLVVSILLTVLLAGLERLVTAGRSRS
ncbi:MAG TPA: ABC transporter permease [Pseudonocardia sp.]|jgi:NitT/TauT family transport system permease protein|nr:ABC transporter permease [Pseudonocardia sp.]